MKRVEALEYGRRPLPFTVVAVGGGFLLWLMPAPDRNYGALAVAAVLGIALVGLAAVCDRVPSWLIQYGLPLGYLLFAAILRTSAGGGVSGFAGLFLLPVLWLALSAGRRELVVGLVGMAVALFVPLIFVGAPEYPSAGWRGAIVLLAVGVSAGFTIEALVGQARMYAAESISRALELEEANAELDRRNRLQADFVALAAHELRTPATSIYGFAETLERHAVRLQPDQAATLRHTLATESMRLIQLVDQLLDLSRLDADAIDINPSRINVREKVQELLPLAAGDRLAEIRLQIPDELEAEVDELAFERIVSNLVTNAIRYGQAPIVVEAAQDDGEFSVTVEDRGDGVPEHLVSSLFDRFTRGAEARERANGTGLGLAIARSYARAHDGELTYEPATPNGTRFRACPARHVPGTVPRTRALRACPRRPRAICE